MARAVVGLGRDDGVWGTGVFVATAGEGEPWGWVELLLGGGGSVKMAL